jgi:hypothetical protein
VLDLVGVPGEDSPYDGVLTVEAASGRG